MVMVEFIDINITLTYILSGLHVINIIDNISFYIDCVVLNIIDQFEAMLL